MHAEPIRFDRFELQPRQRRLLADGAPVPLGARAFDVLAALVARPGELVSKSELLQQVWTGLVVEEANLSVQVFNLRKALGGQFIDTIPGRGYRFTGKLVAPSAPPAPAPVTPPVTPPFTRPAAPPAPTLVGRAADLALIDRALASAGCVTLAGPAGVGKTSLARVQAAVWPGGAAWVDLAPLSDASQIGPALARALGQPPVDDASSLLPALGARLLVLDNAEHLVDASAALVDTLLRAAATLQVLVTSQLPLNVPTERVLRIEPLALPDDGEEGAQHPSAAMALFIERARAADHRFAPEPETLPLLREICQRLDGLPLALEMAAARVASLGLHNLHEALTRRFAVLTRGHRSAAVRHRTLQAALDWSHGLLAPDEQRLFRELGVFSGGFTLDLALSLAAPRERWAVIDSLCVLVDRSLVVAEAVEPPRYRLLETMRAYALEQLAASGDLPALQRRHAQVLADLFERAAAAPSDPAARALALAEHHNIREALAWATAHAPTLAVPMSTWVTSIATYVSWRVEAMNWLEACEAAAEHPDVSLAVRAAWWAERARQRLIGWRPGAHAAAVRARELYRELGDARGQFTAGVSMVRSRGEAPDRVLALCDELQALLEAHPDWPPRLRMLLAGTRAMAYAQLGDTEAQLRCREQEMALARAGGWTDALHTAQTNFISTLTSVGRSEEALGHCLQLLADLQGRESINLAYAHHYRMGALQDLGRNDELRALAADSARVIRRFRLPFYPANWARALLQEGRSADAALLLGHTRQLHQDFGFAIENNPDLTAIDARARQVLGDAEFERLQAQGRALGEGDALALFLSAGPQPGQAANPPSISRSAPVTNAASGPAR